MDEHPLIATHTQPVARAHADRLISSGRCLALPILPRQMRAGVEIELERQDDVATFGEVSAQLEADVITGARIASGRTIDDV